MFGGHISRENQALAIHCHGFSRLEVGEGDGDVILARDLKCLTCELFQTSQYGRPDFPDARPSKYKSGAIAAIAKTYRTIPGPNQALYLHGRKWLAIHNA